MVSLGAERSRPITRLWSLSVECGGNPHSCPTMTETRILYNDRCPICRAEISHYRQKAQTHGAPLVFDDLNQTDLSRWDLSEDQAKRRMHALMPDGTVVSGIPAFAAIWRALPGMGWLARLVQLPVLRGVADLLYNKVAAPLLYWKQVRREARGLAGDQDPT